jgi:glycosyltransferase involved in cell wall biosynthesis
MVGIPVLDRITKVMEKAVYSRVDMGLTITPKLSEYMESLGTKYTQVLPMPVDTKKFYPFKSTIGEKWGITEHDKVILFMGTVFKFSGLDDFIKGLSPILYFQPKAKLLIVGDGEQKKELDLLISKTGLIGKVIITGYLPYEDMPEYINLASVCINPFKPNAITKDIFPGKTVQYLACGKPLVMTRLAGVEALINGTDQGVMYADEIGTMTNNIMGLLENSQRCQDLGDKALIYSRRYHDCTKVAERLEVKLEEMCNV